MASATITAKGQITIPAKVRSALGVDSGDRVEFVPTEAGGFEMIPANRPVQALKGLVSKTAKPVSIERMNRAISRRWSGSR